MNGRTYPLIKPHGRRRLAGALLAALAVAALLLSGSTPGAHAAPPTLTASENPVIVPLGSNTKNITLSWNLNGYPKASLSVQENGGAVVSAFAVVGQTGSLPLTATYGKSYTATLIDPAASGPLATLQITTKRPNLNVDIDIPPVINNPDVADEIANCILRPCITSVALQPHGTYAEFTVRSTKATLFQMAICGVSFSANGSCSHPVNGIFSVQPMTDWSSHVMGLQPSRGYHYLVTARDSAGNETTKTGTFSTLRRRVDVTFKDLVVSDDSDYHSACDCSFWFTADGKVVEWPQYSAEVNIDTGETRHPNVTVTVNLAPDEILLSVFGRDNDITGSIFQTCGGGAPGPGWGSGSNSCWDWAEDSATIQVARSGWGEEFSDDLYIRADGSPLTFRVYITYTVTYVP